MMHVIRSDYIARGWLAKPKLIGWAIYITWHFNSIRVNLLHIIRPLWLW